MAAELVAHIRAGRRGERAVHGDDYRHAAFVAAQPLFGDGAQRVHQQSGDARHFRVVGGLGLGALLREQRFDIRRRADFLRVFLYFNVEPPSQPVDEGLSRLAGEACVDDARDVRDGGFGRGLGRAHKNHAGRGQP